MNVVLKEWLQKADEDYCVATREIRARKNPAYNAGTEFGSRLRFLQLKQPDNRHISSDLLVAAY